MGFDNECILNIESLAGEYFCPVCRTLVYPNEAIQSQCTHLYCKPCLTYVVGTTHACPYDGYLVTEADSKPLIESNKALAETIGKIVVRCLYHRSGCSWQGPLSDCTSHCPGCSFGNSPVVCNRCGVQIVHRQVQEHAQTCSGVNSQAQPGTESGQDAANPSTAASGADQSQTANQVVAPPSSQAQSMPAATGAPPTGQVINQQANVNPPVQAASQGGAPTPEQWYQQQYQQNYQQYPGYDPYQQPYQQYYPYQQQPSQQFQPPHQPQTQPHLQPQVQHQQIRPQPQPQPQAQSQPTQQPQVAPHGQPHVQPHNIQAQVSQAHLPPPGHLPPPPPIYPQTQPLLHPHPQQVQVPQYQQPHLQMHHPQPPQYPQSRPPAQAYPQPLPQLQNHTQAYPHHHQPQPQPSQPTFPNTQPQSQPTMAHAVTGNHSYPQVQANQQMNPGPPQVHPSGQMHGQFPQQPPQMPPQSNALMSSQGQLPNIPPAQQQQVHLPAQQAGYSAHPRPVMHQIQQPALQQYMQQPFPGQALGSSQPHQQHPMQSQLVSPGPPYPVQQNSMGHLQPQVLQGVPPHQSVNYGGRPVLPNHGPQPHSYPQSTGAFGVAPARPMSLGSNQPPGQLNYGNRTNNQLQVSTEQQSTVESGLSVGPPGVERKEEGESPSQKTGEKGANVLGADSLDTKGLNSKSETGMKLGEDSSRKDETLEKDTGSEVHVAKHGSGETLDSLPGAKSAEIAAAEGEDSGKVPVEKVENSVDDSSAGQVDSTNTNLRNDMKNPQTDSFQNVLSQGNSQTSHPGQLTDQGRQNLPSIPHQQGHAAPSAFQSGPPSGPASNAQLPGYPSNTFRPQGPGHFGHPQEHYNQGHSHAGFPRNSHGEQVGGPTPGVVPGSFDQRRSTPHGPEGQFGPQHPINPLDNEGYPNERHPNSHLSGSFERGPFSQSSGYESNMQRYNGADERFRDPFPLGPNRRLDQGEFEKGVKRFPRPSHEGSPKFGNYFDNNPQRGFTFDDKLDSGSGGPPSHFLPPYHSRSDAGERQLPVGFNENNRGRIEQYGFGRSPGREYLGIPPRGFGVDLDGQDMRGPHNLPHMGEPAGFGPFVRRGELGGPGTFPNHLPLGESFGGNKPGHPRIGEPGFRSSYSLQEFPDDGRFYAGETDSFDKLRRKPGTTGWCRICKVDCETVEGLDLHSQTREHQKVTMDMVINIKRQNSKRQKTFSDHSSFEEGRKPRNHGFKNRGAKPK